MSALLPQAHDVPSINVIAITAVTRETSYASLTQYQD